MDRVIIIGGSGASVVIGEAINQAKEKFGIKAEFVGLLNDNEKEIRGYKVLGKLKDVQEFVEKGYKFLYAIYKIGGQEERINLFNSLNIPDENLFTFVHPTAFVSPSVDLGLGTVVMPNSSISAGTKIGKCNLIMSNCTIGHDNDINDFCFFTAKSCLGSYLKIGKGVWVGMNATIRGKQSLGDYSAIGIGSVVVKDIPKFELWVGNPAKYHKSVKEKITM